MTGDRDAIALAERVIGVLDEGGFSATYKFALFTAILDLCVEKKFVKGVVPETLTTRAIAERVVELYWDHATPYKGTGTLRQGGGKGEQAEILSVIVEARTDLAQSGADTLYKAQAHRLRFDTLVCDVEWKLIEMPIPRLQVLGRQEERFLYEYNWAKSIRRSVVTRYQQQRAHSRSAIRGSDATGFDNRLVLLPGVADHLVRLNGILRPLFYREWATMVARMNQLPESELEEFLFGRKRTSLESVREPLRALQGGRCFYCDDGLVNLAEVDHFIPWMRYPDNGLDNLVVAHPKCNNKKRDFLAAAKHVEHWKERLKARDAELSAIASSARWRRHPDRTTSIAKSIYSRLPLSARLWVHASTFGPNERDRILAALEDE
jgi:5-methylcytosine-specific restriction endonuclease McrA